MPSAYPTTILFGVNHGRDDFHDTWDVGRRMVLEKIQDIF